MEMTDKLLFRSCTTGIDFQDYLLECLKINNLPEIKFILDEEDVNLNHIYDHPYYKTALSIACDSFSETVTSETINLLLKYGADPLVTDDNEKNSLNYAAESCKTELLKPILEYLKNNDYDFENTDVLLSLIEHIKLQVEYDEKRKTEQDFIAVIELLLEYEIDINKSIENTGHTAIYLAANYGYKSIISTLLKYGPVNLDKYRNKNKKTARDMIKEKNLYDGILPDVCDENENTTIEIIYKNLRERNIEDFKRNFEEIEVKQISQNKDRLLYISVEKGLDGFVQFLLDKGADCNSNLNDKLLEKAVDKGYYKVVKKLLRKTISPFLVSNSLITLLKIKNISKITESVDYNICLDLLLRHQALKINVKDTITGKTPLHLAAIYQKPEIVLKLLKNGASLASTDRFNYKPLSNMDADTLKTHLDDCIKQKEYFSNDDINKTITIKVTSLLPARSNTEFVGEEENCKLDMEKQPLLLDTPEILQETAVLQYLSQSKEMKHLLKHPVIMTLIFLKWYHIRSFFYFNLTCYLLFFVSLLTYIMFGYNRMTEEDYPVITYFSFTFLSITFVILLCREIGQMLIYRHRYLMIFENWLEIVLLLVTAIILIQQSTESIIRQLSAVAIVLSAIELLLLIGHIPCLSTNIMMLRTVSFTFFKLLLWYSILLLAFAFSFYTLFQEKSNTNSEIGKNETITDDEDQDFFLDPGMSLLKTIVMLTGEFDAGSIKFNSYPIISHLIFVSFVFLITIVLFNLLNGLAVSDTQIIKNDAQLYYQILRVEHIAHIERVLLRNKLLLKWLPYVKKICLFPYNVSKTEIKIYPNQSYKILYGDMDDKFVPTCCQCEGMALGKTIQRAIRAQIQEMHNDDLVKQKDDAIFKQLQALKEQMTRLEDLITNKQ